jgi:hypothetical protein
MPNSQRHVKTEHEANEAAGQENNWPGQVNPQNMPFAAVACRKVRMTHGRFFRVPGRTIASDANNWTIGFSKKWDRQDSSSSTQPGNDCGSKIRTDGVLLQGNSLMKTYLNPTVSVTKLREKMVREI